MVEIRATLRRVKPECHRCSYWNPEATQAYKCYTHKCPAWQEKTNK